jgi:DNA-binding CsgD family transcriptional regulator
VTRARAGPPLPPHWTAPGRPRFVGRESELGTLQDAWAVVGAGLRRVVIVGAESGGGKSRLVSEAATAFAPSAGAVLAGGCVADLGSPYQPFDGPAEALLAEVATGPAEDADAAGTALTDPLSLVAGRPLEHGAVDVVRDYRPRLYGAVVDALRSATADGPLLLVLEDLHWAAPDGLQLLTFVIEHTPDVPMLVLATHRSTTPDRGPRLVQALAALYRLPGVQRMDLGPLRVEDVTRFLALETPGAADRTRTAARALHRHTGGNPFFLREVWRDLVAQGGLSALRDGTIRAPESVRDTLQVRLDALPPHSRRMLELAAVLGDDVDLDLLLDMDAATASPAGPDAVLAAVDTSVAAGLLEAVVRPAGMSCRFPHALARSAVLELMPPSRLARSHAVAVEVLEGHPGVERRVQRLAHHCAAARALGYGSRAIGYLVGAAELADRALAHDEAADRYEEAAALTDDPHRRHELWLRAARSHFLAADFRRALSLDERVIAEGGPRERLAAAIGYEAASWHLAEDGRRAVQLLTAALGGVHRDPADPLYVRALSGLGRALAFSGANGEAAAVAAQAIELGRAIGRDDLLADTLQAGLHVGTAPDSAMRLARAEELTALAERTGDLGHLCWAGYQRAAIGYLRGDRRLLDAAHADMLRAATETGQPFWAYLAAGFEYARLFVSGDLVAADRAAQEQRGRGVAIGAAEHAEGPFGIQTYMVRREAGHLEQIRPLISGAEAPGDHWAPGLLALYTDLGLPDPARRVLRWLLDEGLEGYETSSEWAATLSFLVEAALALEDEELARGLRPRLAEYAGRNLAAGPFAAVFGSADRYLGGIDSLLRRRCAEEELSAAVAMDERMGAPLYAAHSRTALARHLRRVGAPPRRVQELVDRVRETAAPLGLRRVLRLVAAVAPPRGRPDGLTAREIEILRLIADGSSNRAIATTLVISESTAANHVRSIFQKTGAANRTQAARYAATHHLLG